MTCVSCGGCAHPATGCVYPDGSIVCGPCVRAFWAWVRVHTSQAKRIGSRAEKPARFVYFYSHASWED